MNLQIFKNFQFKNLNFIKFSFLKIPKKVKILIFYTFKIKFIKSGKYCSYDIRLNTAHIYPFLQPDVTFFAPAFTPRVLDKPVIDT